MAEESLRSVSCQILSLHPPILSQKGMFFSKIVPQRVIMKKIFRRVARRMLPEGVFFGGMLRKMWLK